MKLKLQSIKRASVPQRQVQQLDRVVQNFKPVSDHKHNVSILILYIIIYNIILLKYLNILYKHFYIIIINIFIDWICRKEKSRR